MFYTSTKFYSLVLADTEDRSNITNIGNTTYKCKDPLLGREVSGFMEGARSTYCRDDVSGVWQVTLQETRFLSTLHLFRGFQLFNTHQIYSHSL